MGDRSRPNIILILVDDMGFSDIGAFGSEIHTPNLDRLAAHGIRLTQMYNGARCCPTRASLLSGLYAQQAGVGHMVNNLGAPGYQGFLNDRCVTLAEALRANGYRTLMSGKWHVGGQYSLDPNTWHPGSPGFPTPRQRGFDRFFGTLAGAGSYYNPHTLMRDDEIITPDGDTFYYTTAIGDEAARMIDETAGENRPFFLYLAFTAPHWPLHAPESIIAHYQGRYLTGWDTLRQERFRRLQELEIIQPEWGLSPRDPTAPAWDSLPSTRQRWEAQRMAVYAAQVECMDAAISTVLAAVERRHASANTLTLFLSDNGGCAEFLREDAPNSSAPPLTRDGRPVRIGNIEGLAPGAADTYMSYDLPWANASNTPFRRYKHWVHEGGIATPCIGHWPAAIPGGTISHAVCHLIDVLPTFLAAAEGTYPSQAIGGPALPLEGESLLPLLSGDLTWERTKPIFWEHEGNCAVRFGRWKLVKQFTHPWELYDMQHDRTELQDLSADHPEIFQGMINQFEAWAARCGVLPWEEIRPRPGQRSIPRI